MSILGIVTIRTNGKAIQSMGGAELDLGGKEREAVVGGGRVLGSKATYKAPNLSVKVAVDANTNFNELQELTDATVDFEADSGHRFLLNRAFRTSTVKISESDGSYNLDMSAYTAEQV